MRRYGGLLLLVLLLLLPGGCSERPVLDSVLMERAAGVVGGDGQLLFAPDLNQMASALEPEDVPFTISPDGQYLLVVRQLDEPRATDVKGPTNEQVRLDFLHVPSGRRRGTNLTQITAARWSPQGKLLAMVSGGRACLLDPTAGSLHYPGSQSLPVTDLGWSPDGSQLYLWHPDAPASVYDLGSNASAVADICYRQPIDDERYLGLTREVRNGQAETRPVIITPATTAMQTLPVGEVLAAQGKALLLATDHGFGLRLLSDVDRPEESRLISEGKYVHQARFLPGGRLAYVTSIADPLRNEFCLTFAAYSGQELASFAVSGAHFVVTPDGSSLSVAGPHHERILTETLELSSLVPPDDSKDSGLFSDPYQPTILAAVRRAAEAYYSVKLGGRSALPEGAFGHSSDLRLTADLDLARQFTLQLSGQAGENGAKWPVEINIKMNKYHYTAPAAASVVVQVAARNSQGVCESAEFCWELRPALTTVRGQDASPVDGDVWVVAGISTFSGTETEQAVRSQVESLLPSLVDGRLFSRRLHGRELAVGQVQFLATDAKTPVADLEQAGYACATLLVRRLDRPARWPAWETERFAVCRLLLQRSGGEWRFAELLDEPVSLDCKPLFQNNKPPTSR